MASPPRSRTSQRRQVTHAEPERREPRLPHERDESSDSQVHGGQGVMKQAHDDVQRGLQDTDRRPPMEQAYEQQKGPGVAGTAPAAPDRSGAGVRKRS